MAYDPREHGAKCASCWLFSRREGGPVPAELSGPVLIVGEAPGKDECQVGRPFVGNSGQELQRGFGIHGFRRGDFSFTNVLCCRPPGNEFERMKYQWARENKRREKLNKTLAPGEEPYKLLPHPVDCCLPRLRRELLKFDRVITLGGTAYRAVVGSTESITSMRGSPHEGWWDPNRPTDDFPFFVELDTDTAETREVSRLRTHDDAQPVKILPAFHPSLILRQRKWTSTFRSDLGKGLRWFYNRLGWQEPEVVIRPAVPEVRAFLSRGEPFYAWDLETDGKEPLTCRLRVFGVGTTRKVLIVPLLSVDGKTHFYTDSDLRELRHIFQAFLEDPTILKAGWNSGYYDKLVAKKQLGAIVRRSFDGILAHHDVESEMPHSLGYAGTTLTDIAAWKQESKFEELNKKGRDGDPILWDRNAKDVAVTAALVQPLEMALHLKDQAEVCRKDHKVQAICAGLHEVGMLVDPQARDAHDRRLLKQIVDNRKICRDIVGRDDFNPNSHEQVAEVLFEEWGLPPVNFSEKTGAPSCDDDSLREYRVKYNLTPGQKRFIEALRKVRGAVKDRGTNVVKFRRSNERVPDDEWAEDIDETEKERAERRKRDQKKMGILLPDGRVHSHWNAHVATTGRLSSSDPAMQNWRRKLRDMIVAGPGNLLVGADSDQLELRYASGHWQLRAMLEILRSGRDPHHETALACFGSAAAEQFAIAQEWAKKQPPKRNGDKVKAKDYPAYSRVRDFSKRLRYAVQYAAEDETVHRVISSTEDDDGNLIYADVSVTETATRRRLLLDADPEYEIGWKKEVETWRHTGCIRERIWGRRRDFMNGEELNEIVNFPIQSGCAALIHDATFDLLEQIPFEKWGPGTGLIHQGHDALVVECPEAEAKWVANTLVECMTRTYPGLDVQFKAGAKIGRRWSEV